MAANEADWFLPVDELSVRATVATTLPVEMQVKERYDALAASGSSNVCCAPGEVYSPEDLTDIPDWVLELSSSCGAPLNSVNLEPGQTVADFGCGAGLDVLLAARRVGPSGRVIGIDGSPHMVRVARRAAKESGFENVDIRAGDIRRAPLRDESVDVLLSNCVVSMFPDKSEILAEMVRVLKPGGYAVMSDGLLADSAATPDDDPAADEWGRCVVGLTAGQYRDLVLEAGFADIEIQDGGAVQYRDGAEIRSARVFAFRGDRSSTSCC